MIRDESTLKRGLSEFYTSSAQDYHESHYRSRITYSPLQYRQRYVEEMIESLGLPAGARILDAGCGPGELTVNLLERGYEVWAIDISEGMVDEARAMLRERGLGDPARVTLGDIESLQFESGFFDVVVAAGVLEYQPTDAPTLHEVKRVLRRGGYMILNVTNGLSPLYFLDGGYRWLKRRSAARAVLDLGKRMLGRGRLNDLPERRLHVPWRFDRTLSSLGFRKVGQRYFHFSPLPTPLDQLLRSVSAPVGRWMERLGSTPLGILGGGYQVLATNEDGHRPHTSN